MFNRARKMLDRAENAVQTVRALEVLTELDSLVDDRISTVLADELENADLSGQVSNEAENLDLMNREDSESMIDEKLENYFRWDNPLSDLLTSELEDQMDTITDHVIEALCERLITHEEFRKDFCDALAGKVKEVLS